MKYCVHCGKLISDDSTYCPYCGARQPLANQKIKKSYQTTVNKNDYKKKFITPPSCDFNTALINFWKKYVDFDGYSSRAECWYWRLFSAIIDVILLIASLVAVSTSKSAFFLFVIVIAFFWWCATIVPKVSLNVRRLRDAGIQNSSIIILMCLDYLTGLVIPIIGSVIGLVSFIVTIAYECKPSVRYVPNASDNDINNVKNIVNNKDDNTKTTKKEDINK